MRRWTPNPRSPTSRDGRNGLAFDLSSQRNIFVEIDFSLEASSADSFLCQASWHDCR